MCRCTQQFRLHSNLYNGWCCMLTKKSASQYDFSPLQGKELILWADNDNLGKKLAELVQELALNANVKSVKMLTLPRGKPERWDVADAISEGFDINEFLNTTSNFTRQNINLSGRQFIGIEIRWSCTRTKVSGRRHTFPLGVPIILSSMVVSR